MRLRVKVAAGASRDAIDGWLGDVLKIRVAAAPERGKANAAVVKLLADRLGLARADVVVVSGHTSPRKVLEFANADSAEISRRLPPREG